MTKDKEYETTLLFSFVHPMHGAYFVWFDSNMNTYGISNAESAAPWCDSVSLAALFKQKGL